MGIRFVCNFGSILKVTANMKYLILSLALLAGCASSQKQQAIDNIIAAVCVSVPELASGDTAVTKEMVEYIEQACELEPELAKALEEHVR